MPGTADDETRGRKAIRTRVMSDPASDARELHPR